MVFDFGYRLRELRLARNMTQTQVAKRLTLSKTTISGYENNIKTPSVEVLKHLAVLYKVPVDYLLGFDKRRMLDVSELSGKQIELLEALVEELKMRS